MAGKIEFFAEAGKWIAVKKLTVTDKTGPLEIVRFLASVHETMDRKIWHYFGEVVDTKGLDEVAAGITGAVLGKKGYAVKGRMSEDKINQVLAKLKSPKTGKAINAIVPTKKGRDLAKVYVTRRALEYMQFPIELDAKAVEKYMNELSDLED